MPKNNSSTLLGKISVGVLVSVLVLVAKLTFDYATFKAETKADSKHTQEKLADMQKDITKIKDYVIPTYRGRLNAKN